MAIESPPHERPDARALRAVVTTIVLFVAVIAVLVIGKTTAVFDADDAPLLTWLQDRSDSPWALPATMVVFAVAGFLGAPQFLLIAGAVVAFGSAHGALYAWVGTLFAASCMFWLGHLIGADTVRRFAGPSVNRLSEYIGRKGVLATFGVRFVPLAPAVVVNMVCGASHISFPAFLLGTGFGIIPKIGLIAFAGGGLAELWRGGDLVFAAALIAGAAASVAVIFIARRMLIASNSSD